MEQHGASTTKHTMKHEWARLMGRAGLVFYQINTTRHDTTRHET